jgi:hypothetical protein
VNRRGVDSENELAAGILFGAGSIDNWLINISDKQQSSVAFAPGFSVLRLGDSQVQIFVDAAN